MKKLFLALAGLVFAPVTAFAQEVTPACDFNGVIEWFSTGNPISKIAGAVMVVAVVVFAFLKKSMPSWVKEIVVGFLGKKAKP